MRSGALKIMSINAREERKTITQCVLNSSCLAFRSGGLFFMLGDSKSIFLSFYDDSRVLFVRTLKINCFYKQTCYSLANERLYRSLRKLCPFVCLTVRSSCHVCNRAYLSLPTCSRRIMAVYLVLFLFIKCELTRQSLLYSPISRFWHRL